MSSLFKTILYFKSEYAKLIFKNWKVLDILMINLFKEVTLNELSHECFVTLSQNRSRLGKQNKSMLTHRKFIGVPCDFPAVNK